MTPRENLKAAIEFRTPERLPVQGYGAEVNDSAWVVTPDVVSEEIERRAQRLSEKQRYDQWMCLWDTTDTPNMGQVKGHPLEDLDGMKDFPWPDPEDPRRFEHVPGRLDEIEADPVQRNKYRRCSLFMILWERMHSLHGFENCMMDILDDDPRIHELADRITDYDVRWIRGMAGVAGDRIDGFGCTEDWGTELDLMVSPETFERFFAPRYRRIVEAVHEAGWHFWMHSCGKINKAVPILIDCGVHVLNLQQPLTNGIEELGEAYAGKVCFESLCDIQHTLPRGDRAEISAQADRLMRAWGTPSGGFILGDYGDARAIGTDPDVKQFMLGEFQRQDPWRHGW